MPDWAPKDAGKEYAVRVVKGVEQSGDKRTENNLNSKKAEPRIDQLVEGVLRNDRVLLGRTITLVESNAPHHFQKAQEVVQKLLPHSGKSIRIGISGVPGAGKSTLIEALGMYLIGKGHKVAVLTVDPSSSLTKGSILGDKTRMERLSREENCFIRPSPSGGTLGGVTRKSRETIIVCESAGYDVILVETVGVGQSEITVRSMVDFFMLILLAGAGDELQGIKKGVIEIADAIVINKADGDNEIKVNITRSQYEAALHYLKPITDGWQTKAFACSAMTGKGVKELWNVIMKFEELTKTSGIFEIRRKEQKIDWVFRMIENELKDSFFNEGRIKKELPKIKEKLEKEEILPTSAAQFLLRLYNSILKSDPS